VTRSLHHPVSLWPLFDLVTSRQVATSTTTSDVWRGDADGADGDRPSGGHACARAVIDYRP
jgi:hypothetical protein